MNQKSKFEQADRALMFHPYNIMMVLAISSLTMIFLAISVSFVYSRVQNGMAMPNIHFPPIFILNTIILLASSATMQWAKKCYLSDQTEQYQSALLYTIILSIVFMISQFIGWQMLLSDKVLINSDLPASYLYLISGLHFSHVIAGLPFLIIFLRTARQKMKEPVSVLVYFSDPEKRLKLRLLTIYWHFLDGLWIYLVLFFLINRYLI